MTVEMEKFLEMPARGELELPVVLHALSDPIRLAVLREVADGAEHACGTFELPVSDSTRSHHLKILREAGVTSTRIVGTQRLVSLRREDLDARFPGLLNAVLTAA
jgi:DNA-binding transcriptional ArsR family regulator